MNHSSQLKIYKASAGSGKTFTLAASYITLLVQNPDAFRRILAVTFTNKATGEMKERILSQLYGIAHALPESEGYLQTVSRLLDEQGVRDDISHNRLDEACIRRNAGKALINILHNYSFFRIETIDSFMLSILRNLAKELDLGSNMDIELDTKKVLTEGVHETIKQLKPDSPELNWIVEYIESSIDDNHHWDVTGQLVKFAQNLHREAYQRNAGNIQHAMSDNPRLIRELREHLYTDKKNAQKALKKKSQEFFDIVGEQGLEAPDFLFSTSGVYGYFLHLQAEEAFPPGKRTIDASENPEKWVSVKSPKRELIVSLAEKKLIPLLNETERIRQQKAKIINTSELILQNLYQLQLIGSIDKKIQEISQETNRWLLADTCTMLMQMATGPSDTSFIYEKTGTEIDHILIDEFQDTSGLQWANFLPLIRENVSRGKKNLIVGDVKQAIYRWRDSNADIMERKIKEDLALARPEEVLLDTNFRSRKNIVDFNTRFFSRIIETIKEFDDECDTSLIADYYKDVRQKAQTANKGGMVRFLEVTPDEGAEDDDSADAMCQATAQEIRRLLDTGIKQDEIAILTRFNHQIAQIAEWVATHPDELGRDDIRIISGEAFTLESSDVIRLLISTLKWINSSLEENEDVVSLAHMGISYHQLVLKDNMSVPEILQMRSTKYGLPSSIVTRHNELATFSLTKLLYELYDQYTLNTVEGHDAFLQTFFDMAQNHTSKEDGSLTQFLSAWDEGNKSKAIPAGSVDGIKAMTIHKAKGLEFHSVIVPFCDWRIEPKYPPTLWVKLNKEISEGLPFVPVQRDGTMKESAFTDDFKEETRQLLTDNLNLLYVAFTRPSANLIVLRTAKKKQKASKKQTNADIPFPKRVSDLIEYGLNETDACDEVPCTLRKDGKEYHSNPLQPKYETIYKRYTSRPVTMPFRQSNASRTYINRGDDTPLSDFIERGNLLHDIFAHTYVAEDAPAYIKKLFRMGVVDDRQCENLTDFVGKALTQPEVQEWFDGSYKLYNECTILSEDKEGAVIQNRPDRVMSNGERTIVVDFKFGEPRGQHRKQVEKYMTLLDKMGFKKIEGFLWYVTNAQIIKL